MKAAAAAEEVTEAVNLLSRNLVNNKIVNELNNNIKIII